MSNRRVRNIILLQIIHPKRRLANPPPRVVLDLPCLACKERLPAPSFRPLVPDVFSKVRPYEIVAVIDVEFSQQKVRRPFCVLDVEYSEHGFVVSFGISVHSAQALDIVDFLR